MRHATPTSTRVTAMVAALSMVASLGAAAADTPLVQAVKNGDVATVRALLKQKADVNAAGPDGIDGARTGRSIATMARQRHALLGAGANVHAANRYGVTVLSLACTNGSATMIERLLRPAPIRTPRCRTARRRS